MFEKPKVEAIVAPNKFKQIFKKDDGVYSPEEWLIILHNSSIVNSKFPIGY
jgi:hypothetical protein